MAKKKKPGPKKQQENESSSEDIEVLSDNSSCSSNENDFTTLTLGAGKAYYPPIKATSKSRYGRKGHEDDDIIVRIENMRKKLEKQRKQISMLTTENNEVKEKLKKLRTHNQSPPDHVRLKQSTLKFSSSQMLDSVMVESSEEDKKYDKQPDSTQPGAMGSDAGSIQCSGIVHRKKKRARIDSDSQPPSIRPTNDMPMNMSEEESETEIEKLLRTQSDMEEKLKVVQHKLLDQKMENKVHDFQDHLVSSIREFRSDLMDCYGATNDDERLQQARTKFGDTIVTYSNMGYTFRVGEDFAGRVERSILSRQTPEQQFTCTKIDNSQTDPIVGDVVDWQCQ